MFMGTYAILKEFQHFIAFKNNIVNHYMILCHQSTAYMLILSI